MYGSFIIIYLYSSLYITIVESAMRFSCYCFTIHYTTTYYAIIISTSSILYLLHTTILLSSASIIFIIIIIIIILLPAAVGGHRVLDSPEKDCGSRSRLTRTRSI